MYDEFVVGKSDPQSGGWLGSRRMVRRMRLKLPWRFGYGMRRPLNSRSIRLGRHRFVREWVERRLETASRQGIFATLRILAGPLLRIGFVRGLLLWLRFFWNLRAISQVHNLTLSFPVSLIPFATFSLFHCLTFVRSTVIPKIAK